jgi:hypothetical protein
MKIRLNKY